MKEGELKLTVHIYKDLITDIETELFEAGVWERAVAPRNSPVKDMYPGWYYVMPITFDTDLHIKLMMRRKHREYTQKIRRKLDKSLP